MKISFIPDSSYAEVSQKSPMRWSVLFVNEDGVATGQHGWWKCKDFLNDCVIYLHTGRKFPMYGFNNELKLNDGVAYVALKNIPDFFEENLGYLNEFLAERGLPVITWHEHDGGCGVQAVIGIDEKYWCSTFTISVITSMIRSCAYAKLVNDISEFWQHEPTLVGYIDSVLPHFVPENFEKCAKILFKNYQYDGTTALTCSTYSIHNAGLQSWLNSGAFS